MINTLLDALLGAVITTASFVVPAALANVSVNMTAADRMSAGQGLFIQNAGSYTIVSLFDGGAVLQNNGSIGNAAPGVVVPAYSGVWAGGGGSSGGGTSGPITWSQLATSNYTALATDIGIATDTTSAPITVTLEAAPLDKRGMYIADVGGNWDKYNLTINGNGHNIVGQASYIASGRWDLLQLQYYAAKQIWIIL